MELPVLQVWMVHKALLVQLVLQVQPDLPELLDLQVQQVLVQQVIVVLQVRPVLQAQLVQQDSAQPDLQDRSVSVNQALQALPVLSELLLMLLVLQALEEQPVLQVQQVLLVVT